jgi:sulfur carrier protein ThiS
MPTKNTYAPAIVNVFLQPEDRELTLPRPKNAQQLLTALGLRSCTALVAREGELLTPDRAIYPGDRLLVRKVTSSG